MDLAEMPPGCGVNVTTDSGQTAPQIAWAGGSRAAVVYQNEASIRFRYLSETGAPITDPAFLVNDADPETLNGNEGVPAIAMGGGRVAVAWAGFGGTAYDAMGDVRVRFFDFTRMAAGGTPSPQVIADRTGQQQNPAIAVQADGTAMVVFENLGSPSGLSGQTYASGSFMPERPDGFVVGEGALLAREPAIAALPSGFIVAFNAGGDVQVQRFATDGTPMGMPQQVLGMGDPGSQTQPDVAAMTDGTAMVVWRDGTNIRGRIVAPDGSLAFMPFMVNTTIGDASQPAIAASAVRFVVVWQDGPAVRGRLFSSMGMGALNREPDPSTDDFVIAAAGASQPDVAVGGPAPGLYMVVWTDMTADPGNIGGRKFPLP
jgi:hypothetical protein